MFSTGDKPGKGAYVCEKCRLAVDIDDDNKTLPYCPCCEARHYLAKEWNSEQK